MSERERKEELKGDTIRVAHVSIVRDTSGPGSRLVIWFQGCPLRCPGCSNRDLWDFNGGKVVGIQDLVHLMRALRDLGLIEGITLSGGEPLAQPSAALSLVREAQSLGLTVVCYTGYTIEELEKGEFLRALSPNFKLEEFLSYVDILIDGRYNEKLAGNFLWRGSSNQRVFFLSDKYKEFENLVKSSNPISSSHIKVSNLAVKVASNVPDEFWRRFERNLINLK